MSLKILKDNQGSALLICLALIAMLTGIAIMSVDRANTDVDLSYNQLHEEQAFYIAEAGMQRAVAQLKYNPSWRTGYLNQPLGNGIYTVALVDSSNNPALGDTVVLMATADVGGTNANLEGWLLANGTKPFRRAAFGDLRLYIHDNGRTDSYNSDSGSYSSTQDDSYGNIGSNADMEIKNNAYVAGNVATANPGDITISGTPTITGDTTSTAPSESMTLVGDDDYTWAEDNNSRFSGMSGSYSFTPGPLDLHVDDNDVVTLQPGTYYFTSIHLDDDSRLNPSSGGVVKIFVDGNVRVDNGAKMNSGGKPTKLNLFSTGTSIDFYSSSEFRGTLYIPNCDFLHSNNAGIYGAVIAKKVEIKNSSVIHFDRALLNQAFGPGDPYKIIAWRQQ